MVSFSKKNSCFSKITWPYALFIMNNHFEGNLFIGEENITILDEKRLFTYCLQAAVEIHERHYFNRDIVYKNNIHNVLSVLYNFRSDYDANAIALQIITDIVEDFLKFLSQANASHILDLHPTVLKWLPNGVIIRYDDN